MNNVVYYLTLTDLKIICEQLNLFFKKHNDPGANFNEVYIEKIESILARPKDGFGRHELHRDIYSKAACYFYFINKLHPFYNGNKRMAIASTYVFLRKNDYMFRADEDVIYNFAKEISMSHDHQEEEFQKVIAMIKKSTRRESNYITDIFSIVQNFFNQNKGN